MIWATMAAMKSIDYAKYDEYAITDRQLQLVVGHWEMSVELFVTLT